MQDSWMKHLLFALCLLDEVNNLQSSFKVVVWKIIILIKRKKTFVICILYSWWLIVKLVIDNIYKLFINFKIVILSTKNNYVFIEDLILWKLICLSTDKYLLKPLRYNISNRKFQPNPHPNPRHFDTCFRSRFQVQ